MGKNDKKKKLPPIKNYEVWSKYLCEIFQKPMGKWNEDDKKKFLAYYKFSFPYRREYITEKEPSATAVKKLYPYLFHKKQVFMEFELIAEKSNMFESFKRKVDLYAPEIMKQSVSSPFKEKIENQMKKADGETRKWIEKIGSLLLLPRYLAEERKGMIIFSNEAIPTNQEGRPYIKCEHELDYVLQKDSSFKIIIEEIELCTVADLFEAYFAVVAAYYIFNSTYPACCQNTFHCLEKLYIEYAEGDDELESSAEELIAALEKYGHQKKGKEHNNVA